MNNYESVIKSIGLSFKLYFSRLFPSFYKIHILAKGNHVNIFDSSGYRCRGKIVFSYSSAGSVRHHLVEFYDSHGRLIHDLFADAEIHPPVVSIKSSIP